MLVGITSLLLLLHGAGWFTAAIVVWQNAALHIPRAPSSISLGLHSWCRAPPPLDGETGGWL